MIAQGSISKAEENLATALAGCSAFQTWVGATTSTQALNRIHFASLPDPEDGPAHTLQEMKAYRPYVLVWTPSFRMRREAAVVFDQGGWLMTRWVQNIPEAITGSPGTIMRWFQNNIGLILDGLDQQARAGVFDIRDMVIDDEPTRGDEAVMDTMGDYVLNHVAIAWGAYEGLPKPRFM